MGAGASSVDEGRNSEVLEATVNQVENGAEAIEQTGIDEQFDEMVSEVGSVVGPESKEGVKAILESVRGMMNSEQLKQAVDDFKTALPKLQGDAVFVCIAGSLQSAAEMSGPVVAGVGSAILVLGEHLPYIAVAAGAVGAIIYTFKLSKDYDDNVKNVSMWMTSVRDWLMLVAAKISKSGATSTIPLFEGLRDAMVSLNAQMEAWRTKWRVSKMLCSTTFERDFTRVKTLVLELKEALRDYLDEETQQRQESQLEAIASLHLDTHEKLCSMDDQLVLIREMLFAQEDAKLKQEEADKAKKERDSKTEVKEEVERIFQNIQRAAGVDESAAVGFRSFVLIFETFFYGGADMPLEQRRGLNIAVDKDRTKFVTKAAWIKFYHQWTASNIVIEEFLNKIADENPTLLKATTAKAKVMTKQGADIAKKKLAEGLSRIGFRKKSSEGQSAELVQKS